MNKKWRWMALSGLILLMLVATGGYFWGYRQLLVTQLQEQLSQVLGHPVRWETLSIGWRGQVRVAHLAVEAPQGQTLLSIRRAEFSCNPWSVWKQIQLTRLQAEGIQLQLERSSAGRWNWQRSLSAAASPKEPATVRGAHTIFRAWPEVQIELELREARINWQDDLHQQAWSAMVQTGSEPGHFRWSTETGLLLSGMIVSVTSPGGLELTRELAFSAMPDTQQDTMAQYQVAFIPVEPEKVQQVLTIQHHVIGPATSTTSVAGWLEGDLLSRVEQAGLLPAWPLRLLPLNEFQINATYYAGPELRRIQVQELYTHELTLPATPFNDWLGLSLAEDVVIQAASLSGVWDLDQHRGHLALARLEFDEGTVEAAGEIAAVSRLEEFQGQVRLIGFPARWLPPEWFAPLQPEYVDAHLQIHMEENKVREMTGGITLRGGPVATLPLMTELVGYLELAPLVELPLHECSLLFNRQAERLSIDRGRLVVAGLTLEGSGTWEHDGALELAGQVQVDKSIMGLFDQDEFRDTVRTLVEAGQIPLNINGSLAAPRIRMQLPPGIRIGFSLE